MISNTKEIVPFGEEYEIPNESDEEDPSAASTEQLDEEIEVDNIPSTPLVSSPMPQFTTEEADVEEIDEEDEDVDIGCTTPILNDDYWESHHPIHHYSRLCNRFLSPLFRPKKFTWALKNLKLLFLPSLKKFQRLALM